MINSDYNHLIIRCLAKFDVLDVHLHIEPASSYLGPKAGPVTGGGGPGAAGEGEVFFCPCGHWPWGRPLKIRAVLYWTEASVNGILTTSWAFNLKGSLSRLWLARTFQLLAFPEYHLAMVARVSPA